VFPHNGPVVGVLYILGGVASRPPSWLKKNSIHPISRDKAALAGHHVKGSSRKGRTLSVYLQSLQARVTCNELRTQANVLYRLNLSLGCENEIELTTGGDRTFL